LLTDGANRRSLWEHIKIDPGSPTLKEFRRLIERLQWLKSLGLSETGIFAEIPPVKLRHYVQEAYSLDAARMLRLDEDQPASPKASKNQFLGSTTTAAQ